MKLASLHGKPEIFHTIQGEGRSMGMPSVFVRLSLCNLHCTWCDTDYTWNWQGTRFSHVRDKESGYQKYDPAEMILERDPSQVAGEILSYDCPNVVITGGEPLMQQEELVRLLVILRENNELLHAEVETNGTIVPIGEFNGLIDQYNVSPKLENSGNRKTLRDKPQAMRFFADSDKSTFKFVVDTPDDLDGVLALCRTYGIPPARTYLMPQGTDPQQLAAKRTWLTDICLVNNFHFTDRMHIHLFGNRRGV